MDDADTADTARIEALLRSLVPEMTGPIEITDVLGRVHMRPGVVSARTQIRVAALLDRIDLGAMRSEVRERLAGDPTALGTTQALVGWVAGRPDLLDLLDEAVEVLFPGLAAAAAEGRHGAPALATHQFALEDLAQAVLPFVARPLLRFLGRPVVAAAAPSH